MVQQMIASVAGDEELTSLPILLTPDETFGVLRVGRTKGYELLRAGKIPSIRLGRQFRVPRDALLEFMRGDASQTGAGLPTVKD
jgi:excisionase family DNA binding protein